MPKKRLQLKKAEVAGGQRKLHNEKVYNLYNLSNIVRLIKSMGKMRNACKVFCHKTLNEGITLETGV
jgi:hypothetical protein